MNNEETKVINETTNEETNEIMVVKEPFFKRVGRGISNAYETAKPVLKPLGGLLALAGVGALGFVLGSAKNETIDLPVSEDDSEGVCQLRLVNDEEKEAVNQ